MNVFILLIGNEHLSLRPLDQILSPANDAKAEEEERMQKKKKGEDEETDEE